MIKAGIFLIILSAVVMSCANNDETTVKFISPDALYFDYQVWGDDEKNIVTVMLQFRRNNEEGKPVALTGPSKVALDGATLQVDSTKKSGAFYEYSTTIDSFAGKHSIRLTGKTGQSYEEKFEFKPFRINNGWKDSIRRDGITLQLEGLEKEDCVRVIALDTAFRSRGINETDTVKNGRLILTREQLKNLVNGPVRLEIYKEQEKAVKNGTSAGGYLLITYGVKRNFSLQD